ncbi:MAG: hypothetical protein U1A72_04775 [Sulfuritalea sp.]|nr:hypothetical protein [Sulfuritalea sp.]
MTRLDIGATHSLDVDPHPLFVPTGLKVAPGERYRFTATGKWKDWFRIRDATGWSSPLQRWNRVPNQPFSMLCGCIGTDETNAFVIGTGREWPVPETATDSPDHGLNLFANDLRGMYWNNRALPPPDGPLRVEITRIA